MRTTLTMVLALAGLLLSWTVDPSAQQRAAQNPSSSASPGPAGQAAAPGGSTLTAETYRDLIVNVADPMRDMGTFAQITAGTGTQYVNGRPRACIMTFTVTESATQDVARRRKAWTSARPPRALAASHAAIVKWMASAEAAAKKVPTCFEPLLQASAEQYGFLTSLGEYDDLRKNAATALAGMGVTLPEITKPAAQK